MRYETLFPTTQTPLDEGIWKGGHTDGGNVWSDCEVNVAGKANGRQGIDVTTSFHDGTALVRGTWPADQYVKTVVFDDGSDGTTHSRELEIRLNSDIAATPDNHGYEISFSNRQGTGGYVIIMRWNGPDSNFTEASTFDIYRKPDGVTSMGGRPGGSLYDCINGDTLEAWKVGSHIFVAKNGQILVRAIESTYAAGLPGWGQNLETGNATLARAYGITSFVADSALIPTVNIMQAGTASAGSAATVSKSLTSVSSSNSVIALAICLGGGVVPTTVSDDQSNKWDLLALKTGTAWTAALFECRNPAAATTNFTANYSGTATAVAIYLFECKGLRKVASAFDGIWAYASSTGVTLTGPSITPTQSGCLFLTIAFDQTAATATQATAPNTNILNSAGSCWQRQWAPYNYVGASTGASITADIFTFALRSADSPAILVPDQTIYPVRMFAEQAQGLL